MPRITHHQLGRDQLDGSGRTTSPELLLQYPQVNDMPIRNENSLGHEHRRTTLERLKYQHHSRRWVTRSGSLQQVLAEENPGCVLPVTKQSFLTEIALRRGGQ